MSPGFISLPKRHPPTFVRHGTLLSKAQRLLVRPSPLPFSPSSVHPLCCFHIWPLWSLLSLAGLSAEDPHSLRRERDRFTDGTGSPHGLGPGCTLETHRFLPFHCHSLHPMSPGKVQVVPMGICGSTHNGRKWGLAWSRGLGSSWAPELRLKGCHVGHPTQWPRECPDSGS